MGAVWQGVFGVRGLAVTLRCMAVTYPLTLADAAAYDAAFPASKPILSLGPGHHLKSIGIGSAGTLAGTLASVPTGASTSFSTAVLPGTIDFLPASLDSTTTTCWPVTLFYGPMDRSGK